MVLQFLIYLVLFPVALALCVYLGSNFAHRHIRKNEIWKPVGTENGLISIFALVISFSLFIAGNHAKERETSIHQEADALSILMRKSKFYEPVLQKEVHQYMSDFYAIQLSQTNPEPKEIPGLIASLEKLDNQIDDFLRKYVAGHKEASSQINELIQMVENAGDKYVSLLYSYSETSPKLITILLFTFSCLISFLIGFMNRIQANKHYITIVLFILIITIMTYVIHDLDSPSSGFIKPDYSDIISTKLLMNKYYK